MKKSFALSMVGVLAMSLLATGCGTATTGSSNNTQTPATSSNKTIGFAVSTLSNPFFVTMKNGVEAKAKELGLNVVVDNANNDASKQLNQVQDLIQQKVGAIILNPTDSKALSSAVKMANDANIPVITLDRSVDEGKVAAFITSNNVEAGKLAADQLIKALNGHGKVVELQGIPGTSAARDRQKGFENELKTAPGIQIVASQPADFDRTKALNVMQNILQAHPDINAVFAHNDEMALGALKAIQAAGKTSVFIVGIDGEQEAITDVNQGKFYADIAQQPEKEGEMGVDYANQILSGKQVQGHVDSPLEVVTKGSNFKGF